MAILVIVIFVLGYLAIAFEHPLKLNKAASALLTGVFCWTAYMLSGVEKDEAVNQLMHHLGNIASILFFLLGAMTIVELIDSHNGFSLITDQIKTRSKVKLLWIITILTFFISSVLDNLTTAIVMTSLTAKILSHKEDRLWFAGMIIIAANAGGAFSPLGDVTTTMLWIGGQISAINIILQLFIPSILVCLVPLLFLSPRFKNEEFEFKKQEENKGDKRDSRIILIAGLSLLLFVPVFKMVTHLPPFMGILLALGLLWILVAVLSERKPPEQKFKLSVTHALERIDTPSILFFLGILLAVSALESFHILKLLATFLDETLGNNYVIATALGLLSAIVDNVPLVAASQGMYDLTSFPTDHYFWELIALTTGTGGSVIIIGSAAGVAAMGIEKIDFMWYLKNISWLALAGFLAGIGFFILQRNLIHG
jgi:Na+/H+ antiporter NhaD/arsenite permease-like protein